MGNTLGGRAAIEALASRFPQLYVAPAYDAEEAYKRAALSGIAPEDANLDHFVGDERDELREVETPAGPIEVLFLANRADFERFLQIMGHRARPEAIAPSIGAITYRGLADWGKVADAARAYIESGGDNWPAEFARLAKEPGSFRSEIIAISGGPYSNIAAERTPFGPDEWLEVSREIRLHHECAHVVCRRLMPDNIAPVWDEVTADMVGLLCATGRFDASLEDVFLGVSEQGYVGGRLEEYLDEEQRERIDDIAREVHAALVRLEEDLATRDASQAFDILLEMKRSPLIAY